MRYLLCLSFYFVFALSVAAQDDLDLNWGPSYDRLEAERQHFFYLGEIDDHYYLRTGKDNEILLHKLDHSTHKVVKTLPLKLQYQGLEALFDRFIYLPSGVYGYFKVPDPDNSQLILVVAPFDGEEFGALREVFRHKFIKIPALFKGLYSFVQRDWIPRYSNREQLVYSPDSSYVAYANYETPRGYAGTKSQLDYHVVVFGNDFEIEQEVTLLQLDSEHGAVEKIVVNNEGTVYGLAKKYTRRSEWKGELEGKYAPRYLQQLVYLDGTAAKILELELGEGRGVSSMDLSWKPDGTTLHVIGLYTDGLEKSMATGYYLAEGNSDGLVLLNTAPLKTDLVDTEITTLYIYKRDLESNINDKKIDSVKDFGTNFSLLACNYNEDGTISWVLERKLRQQFQNNNGSSYVIPVRSALLVLQTDAQGNLLNERLIDRLFAESSKNTPPLVTFMQGDNIHLIYPNMRTLTSRRNLDESLKSGGLLEYLVLEPSGETAHFEVLQSNLTYFFDFNMPLAFQQNGTILFGNLTRSDYSLGSYEINK